MPSIAVPEATTAPTFKSAHFIGVGGAGMSGIALVLHERGCRVTGSDLKTSRYIRQLTRAGVPIHVGHAASTIDEFQPDVVVVSTAIPETNPELVRARELGIPVWHRAKMLSALGYGRTTVACRRHPRQDDHVLHGRHHARPHGARPELFDRRCRGGLRHQRQERRRRVLRRRGR